MRTVVLSKKAQAILDAEIARFPRLEDVYRGLEWRIARDTGAGKPLPNTRPKAYLIRWRELGPTPSLMLVYRETTKGEIEVVSARVRPSTALVGTI